MPAALATLPPELYTAILLHIPTDALQQTTLSLTKALPHASVPEYHMFMYIRLKHAIQAVLLDRRLRRAKTAAAWVREFALETWTVDADVVCNLIGLLPKLTALTLFIGTNFAPEHLEQIFDAYIPGLILISLRFRPYVKKATYYQFLKGAYFDSTLHALSRWPRLEAKPLLSLSIVQDLIDPEIAQQQRFAQPIVFFRLDSLTSLVTSEYLRSLKSFRFRIPSRQFVRFLCMSPDPLLEFLDISTGTIAESEVETILSHFTKLRHLILDQCNMKRLDLLDGGWIALGKSCAIAGVRRAKEREKKLKTWLETNAIQAVAENAETANAAEMIDLGAIRRSRPGRRGLATAAFSLRERNDPPRPGAPRHVNITVQKIRISPPLPSLASLAVTATSHIAHERQDSIRRDFERGWGEGLAQLSATRSRLRHSLHNGIRIVRFSENVGASEDGLEGLVDVEVESLDGGIDGDVPLLCLVGPGRKDGHMEGCGHSRGWEIWNDDI